MTKMTKKEAFRIAQDALNTIETVEADRAWTVLQNEIDRLERVALKAKSAEKRPTKAQRENEVVKAHIMDTMATFTEPVQAKTVAEALNISYQKAASMLKQLINEGAVRKVEGEKRTTLFTTQVAE